MKFLFLAVFLLASNAVCQGHMITPTSFPCRGGSGSSVITHYAIGQRINIKWEIEFDEPFYVDLSTTGKDTDFQNIGTLLSYSDKIGGIAQAHIKLPENVKCDNCTLRLRCAERLSCAKICISDHKSYINIQRPGDAEYNKRSANAQMGGPGGGGGGKKRNAQMGGPGGGGGGKKRSAQMGGPGGGGGGKKRSAQMGGPGGGGGGKKRSAQMGGPGGGGGGKKRSAGYFIRSPILYHKKRSATNDY